MKQPDFSFIPIGPYWPRDFPSVILESGWESTGLELADERRLWHEGSEGRVRVVIFLKLHRPNAQNQVRATLEISRTTPPSTTPTITHHVPFLLPTLRS